MSSLRGRGVLGPLAVLAAVVSSPTLAQQRPAPPDAGAPQGTTQGTTQGPAQAPAPESSEAPALSEEDARALEEAFGKGPEGAGAAPGGDAALPPPPAPPVSTGSGGIGSLPITGPNMAVILDVAGAAFSGEAEADGLQTGAHDPTRNGFNLQQLEMSLGASVDPFLRFDANLVFSQFGVEIEEAYATSLALPAQLQVRAGQFLTRFGRINNTHPHAWDFADQPFMHGRLFGGEGNRGLGVEASWLAPLPWSVELVGSATDARGQATARSFFGADDRRVAGPLDVQLTGALKQFYELSDDLSLLWGLSAATGPNATGFGARTDVYGTDLFFKWRPLSGAQQNQALSLQAEALLRRRQVPGNVLVDAGGYAQAVYRFLLQWGLGARYQYGTPESPLLGASGTLGVAASTQRLDPLVTAGRHRASAALTFWPTEFSRFRLQANADLPLYDRDEDPVRERFGPVYSLFLTGEVVVGAHGAHAF